jgi:hypothetical protein
VKQVRGKGFDGCYGIASYADGSCVVTGSFSETATFGEGEPGETNLVSAGIHDIFIAKYNANGTLAGAKRVGGIWQDVGYGIASYTDGSCVVTGSFSGTATFGEGEPGETTLHAGVLFQDNIFIAKYNPNGTLAWAKQAGGPYLDYGYGIASYADGSCVITGSISETATFGEGEPGETTLHANIFIAKYNANGTLAWVKGAGEGYGNSIASYADGSCVVTGDFYETATFGEGEPGETNLVSAGIHDIFIAKYNANGTLAGAKRAGGTDSDYGFGIASYADGSCVVTGSFSETATFGEGEPGEASLISAGYDDIFIAKYNANGTLAWAKRVGNTDFDGGNGIASYADGASVVTGKFEGTITFGEGEPAETSLDSADYFDGFIAKYSSSPAQNQLNDTTFNSGDTFTAMFVVNESIERTFTVFAVIITPGGRILNARTLSSEIKPVAKNVRGLNAGFRNQIISTTIPAGGPKGAYELVVAFFDPTKPITGRADAFLDVSSKFTIQ